VAKNGNNSNIGSINEPLKSIEKAIQKAKLVLNEPVNVFIRGGVYKVEKSIEVLNVHRTINTPIQISAYQKEKVFLNGGESISVEHVQKLTNENVLKLLPENSKDKIYQINLRELGISNYGKIRRVGFARPYGPTWMEIFLNKTPLSLSRWPNNDKILIGDIIDKGSVPRQGDYSNRGGEFRFDIKRPERWKNAKDLWVAGYFMYGYADDMVKVAKLDLKKKSIKTTSPTLYGFGKGKIRKWYAVNLLEEIDQEGEYFIDRENGIAYFFTEKNINTIEVSQLSDPMICIENSSYIRFCNLCIENARGMGVYMENTQNCLLDNNVYRNLGMMAVCIGKGVEPFKEYRHEGTSVPASRKVGSIQQHMYENTLFNRHGGFNNGITNSVIYQTGAGGIMISGGDRKTLTPAGNYVHNCKIYNFNRIEKSYRAGIDISGVGNKISNCEIFNAPSMAILLHGNQCHLVSEYS
jgi:hypothetical protein